MTVTGVCHRPSVNVKGEVDGAMHGICIGMMSVVRDVTLDNEDGVCYKKSWSLGGFCFNMLYRPSHTSIHVNTILAEVMRCDHTFTCVISFAGFCFHPQEMAGRHRALDCITVTLAGLHPLPSPLRDTEQVLIRDPFRSSMSDGPVLVVHSNPDCWLDRAEAATVADENCRREHVLEILCCPLEP